MVNPAANSVVGRRLILAAAVTLLLVPAICLGSTVTVTSAADSGANTLRAALAAAGAGDTIAFNLPVPANPPPFPLPVVPTIAILSPLAMATNNVTIDGTTQPAFTGKPGAGKLIEINGAGAGAGNSGIVISATGCKISGLVINRCPNHGIDISGASNTIAGNFIGTNAFGNSGLDNGGDGIHVTSSGNTIGGINASSRNVCSGNALAGIELTGAGAATNTVQGNYCGVNTSGSAAVGNFDGILVTSGANGNTIGGPVAGAGNLCSGNAHDGIHVVSSNNTLVAGNFVGVNAAGTAIITNAGIFGIEVSGCTGTTVGGPLAGSRNVVGGNADGIELDAGSTGNTVQGNFSGVGADGLANVGNRLHGIVLRDAGVQNNLIGGTASGAGNTVGNNGSGGIAIFGDPATNPQNTGNAILGNSVYLNGRNNPASLLGIDLVSTNGAGGPPSFPADDGHTANSNPIAAVGPNHLQNAPVLTGVVRAVGGGTAITGTLFAQASIAFRVEFFGNVAASQTGFGEGQTFLGFANVTTGADGNAVISATLGGSVLAGQFVTATATDPNNNTSEFSNALIMHNFPPDIASLPVAIPNPATVAQPVGFTASATDPENDPLTYAWNFGDGSNGAGASVSHAYALPGAYTATVSVSDGTNPAISAAVLVTVNAAASIVGTGPDSDGDGFSDAFETAAGTDPSAASSTPTGQAITAAQLQALVVSKASIKLNFAKGGGDSISLSGTLAIPAGFAPNGTKVYFDVGGVVKVLTLNSKGAAKNGGDSAAISFKAAKGVVSTQTAKYSAAFKKGTFTVPLAAVGLTNADAIAAMVTVPITFIFNTSVLQKMQAMSYTAKKGKSGSAK